MQYGGIMKENLFTENITVKDNTSLYQHLDEFVHILSFYYLRS